MPAFQPLPRRWMMTDERMGDGLPAALDRLPAGSGIVFRHYSLAPADRRALFEMVRDAARRRDQLLLLAGPAGTAIVRRNPWRFNGITDSGPRFVKAHSGDLSDDSRSRRDPAASMQARRFPDLSRPARRKKLSPG